MKLKITNKGQSEIVECEKVEIMKYEGRRKPKVGETYWTVPTVGIIPVVLVWGRLNHDNFLYSMGLVFRTEAECQAYIDYTQAVVRVNDKIDELSEGFYANWLSIKGSHDVSTAVSSMGYSVECRIEDSNISFPIKETEIAKSLDADLQLIFNYKKK